MAKQVQNFKSEWAMSWKGEPVKEFTHKVVDRSIDKGINVSNAAGKTSIRLLIPAIVSYAMSMLSHLGVPEAVSKPLEGFCSQKSIELLDPAVDACTTSTNNISKTSLRKSIGTSWDISNFLHNRFFSWFRR